jgi:hypothetical protein
VIDTFKAFVEKTFKPGDKVENINPDCNHYKSKGTVTAIKSIKGKKGNVIGKRVEYKCDCDGKTWSKNQELEKTIDQLKKK